jgi:hypothetical protein
VLSTSTFAGSRLQHVAGFYRVGADHVFRAGQIDADLDRRPEVADLTHHREHQRGTGHVTLLLLHRSRSLKAQTARIESYALSDQSDVTVCGGLRMVAELDETRLAWAGLCHSKQGPHFQPFNPAPVVDFAFQTVVPGQRARLFREKFRRCILSRDVDQIAGKVGRGSHPASVFHRARFVARATVTDDCHTQRCVRGVGGTAVLFELVSAEFNAFRYGAYLLSSESLSVDRYTARAHALSGLERRFAQQPERLRLRFTAQPKEQNIARGDRTISRQNHLRACPAIEAAARDFLGGFALERQIKAFDCAAINCALFYPDREQVNLRVFGGTRLQIEFAQRGLSYVQHCE